MTQEKTCFTFRAERWYPVANLSIQHMINVYEYAETGMFFVTKFDLCFLHKGRPNVLQVDNYRLTFFFQGCRKIPSTKRTLYFISTYVKCVALTNAPIAHTTTQAIPVLHPSKL